MGATPPALRHGRSDIDHFALQGDDADAARDADAPSTITDESRLPSTSARAADHDRLNTYLAITAALLATAVGVLTGTAGLAGWHVHANALARMLS